MWDILNPPPGSRKFGTWHSKMTKMKSCMAGSSYGRVYVICSILRPNSWEFVTARCYSIFWSEVESFDQRWSQFSEWREDSGSQAEPSLSVGSWHSCFFRHLGNPPWSRLWHVLVLISAARCWSFVLWCIKSLSIMPHVAQSMYGRLHGTD